MKKENWNKVFDYFQRKKKSEIPLTKANLPPCGWYDMYQRTFTFTGGYFKITMTLFRRCQL